MAGPLKSHVEDEDGRDEAQRVYKYLKAEGRDPETLTYRELGLLYAHRPWALPDICSEGCLP